MKTSDNGIQLLKKFEGCRLQAYILQGEKYYTIGYGHSFDPTITANTVWTQAQAEAALRIDLQKFENYVMNTVPIPLTQSQFDALVSYTYNRGLGGLKQLVSNSKTINDYSENIVKYWGSATRYKDALIKRRKAEKALFDGGTVIGNNTRPNTYQVGKVYTLQSNMYVRQTPGGEKIKFDSFTQDAKRHGHFDNEGNGILNSGTRVTCKEVVNKDKQIWIHIPSGWVCAVGEKTYII